MIFIDTSFWFALRRGADAHHAEAAALLRRHDDQVLLTSTSVRGETWTLINRREGHAAAVAFLDATAPSARLVVEHIDAELERAAEAWLRGHDEREYSFVDATSYALMRRRGLQQAFAFDGDFSAAGFVELRP